MARKTKQFYVFANFRLDVSEKILLHEGNPVPLTPKVFDTLKVLLENAGHLLEKDELIQKIWQDRFVEESNLTFNIKMLRRALGDNAAHPRFIETVPRRGYRFIAEVKETFQASESNNGAAKAFFQMPEKISAGLPVFKKLLLPAAIISIFGAMFTVFWFARTKSGEAAPVLFAPFASEKLSTNGKVGQAAVSPDGKNVIYVNGYGGDRQSVWLRQLESGNNVEIIPPSENVYAGLAFSPDGNFLYFARRPRNAGGQLDIYRVSIFGGIPNKIVSETQGWISLSPDGSRISFVRCYYRDDEYCSLWVADGADGKNERRLASRPAPLRIGDNEISPDGKRVAFAAGQSRNAANEFALMEVDIETGVERELTTEKFFNIKSLAWLPDKSGLLVTASRIPNKNFRIWQVSLASGTAEPLTKDSETYAALSLDKEASFLVSTQVKEDFHLQVIEAENPSTKKILADALTATFAPDGKIIFSSKMSGNDEIWSINTSGSGQRQLTNDAADDWKPVVSPDGNLVFFTSNRTGEAHVWRMNADGSLQTKVTKTEGGFPLSVSPDGSRVYYHHGIERTLWRASARGGEEQQVLNKRMHHFAVSPGGLQVAFLENRNENLIIEIAALSNGQTVKTFQIANQKHSHYLIEWMPDNSGVVFVSAEPNENYFLCLQPLNGKTPKKIADLGSEEIISLSVSPDGKSFAVVKGGWRHDAVLLKGLK